MATRSTRSYNDYLIEIGDRVEFIVDGRTMRGTVGGRSFSGSWYRIDDGSSYDADSGEDGLTKLFRD